MQAQTQNLTLLCKPYQVLLATTLLLVVSALSYIPTASAEKITRPMVIYKSPTCGCCGAWVDHIEQAGFNTKIKHPKNLSAIKEQLGVSPPYRACHTGALKGYVFEGHVPANVIQQFLIEKPSEAIGLSVPGMPLGSPGMETDGTFRPYQVLQLNKDGSSAPYAEISQSKTTYLKKEQ